MVSAIGRSIFIISSFIGYKEHFAGYILTLFAIVVLILTDKSFKKNSDSIKII